MRIKFLAVPLVLASCGGASEPAGPAMVAGFDPEPPAAGFTRFVAPIIPGIKSGEDTTYCQWISAPSDRELSVVRFKGLQSHFGHHVVVYANKLVAPVGTSRPCTSNDMLSVRFVGATPGEGAVKFDLPAGVVFRIPAGEALMVNTHFINTSLKPVDGQALIDLELRDAADTDRVAGAFANYSQSFVVTPGQTATADTNCVVKHDMTFIVFSNHMHEWGKSAYSEVVRADGSREMLTRDDTWNAERVFDPQWTSWTEAGAMKVKTGDTIHTRCTWENTTATDLEFPKEMCVGFGFYLPGGPEVNCGDGAWDE